MTTQDRHLPCPQQTIFSNDRQPITALLLLDMSASMEDRWMRVRDAAVQFVEALERAVATKTVDPRVRSLAQIQLWRTKLVTAKL